MSPKPISLSIQDKTERIGLEVPPFEDIDAAEKAEEKKLANLVQKLKLHTVKSHAPTEKESTLPKITTQINCSFDVDAVLQKNIDFVRPKARKRGLSISERVVESATDLWDYLLIVLTYLWVEWVFPVAKQTFIMTLMAHRIVGESIMLLAQSRVGPHQVALIDISATAQQVDLRLQQFCYWPIQYLTLKARKRDWECISTNHSEYIRFYNSLWLVANDVIMGVAIGTYIIENASGVAAQADKLMGLWSLDGLRRIISWLMVYPGGLKLNNELARFLGDLFIWVIDYWGGKSLQLLVFCGRSIHMTIISSKHRLHRNPATFFSLIRPLHRLRLLRRRNDAPQFSLRLPFPVNFAHPLLLYRFRAYLLLAAHHHNLSLPSVPRQEAQCSTESY